MAKKFEIRNSTAEFLTFVAEGKEDGIQVVYQDETIWVTQQAMAELFDVKVPTINYHLSQVFKDGELQEDRTIRKIRIVQLEGTRNVEREPMFYNLDAIISVGYRVNSIRATQFRQWCTYVLRQYALRGYVIDKKRIDAYLASDERPLLMDAGTVSHEYAKEYAETEFEKYRILQDRLFSSDFDKLNNNGEMPELPFDDTDKQ